jgi:hypothetical protein
MRLSDLALLATSARIPDLGAVMPCFWLQGRPAMNKTLWKWRACTAMLAAGAAVLSACGGHEGDDEGNALMKPGSDCLTGCHSPGGSAREKAFSAAGTVYPAADSAANAGLAGVKVVITDANDQVLTLYTNAAGNFYTAAAAAPLKGVYVERGGLRIDMGGAPGGACGACHQPADSGRVFLN